MAVLACFAMPLALAGQCRTPVANAMPSSDPQPLAWLPQLIASLGESEADLSSAQAIQQMALRLLQQGQRTGDAANYTAAKLLGQRLSAQSQHADTATFIKAAALVQLHEFAAAEQLAESLATQTDWPAAWRLLGDARMEQGKLSQAGMAYDAMLRLGPSPLAWSRAAEWRFRSGDLAGALAAIGPAIDSAARSGDPASLAWMMMQAGKFLLAGNQLVAAERLLADAHGLSSNPTNARLLALAQVARGQTDLATTTLRQAFERYPSPSLGALLVELLPPDSAEAVRVRQRIETTGSSIDSLGYAHFLLDQHEALPVAQQLVCSELAARRDVSTLTVAARLAVARGDWAWARALVTEALAKHSNDPLLHLTVAQWGGSLGLRGADETKHLQLVEQRQWLLSPGQRAQLAQLTQRLALTRATDQLTTQSTNPYEEVSR